MSVSTGEYGQSIVDGICECGSFVARGDVAFDYEDDAGARHFVCVDCAERMGAGDVPIHLVRAATRMAQETVARCLEWKKFTSLEVERFWHNHYHLAGHEGPHWPIGDMRQIVR
jgi:hypothetical protein